MFHYNYVSTKICSCLGLIKLNFSPNDACNKIVSRPETKGPSTLLVAPTNVLTYLLLRGWGL